MCQCETSHAERTARQINVSPSVGHARGFRGFTKIPGIFRIPRVPTSVYKSPVNTLLCLCLQTHTRETEVEVQNTVCKDFGNHCSAQPAAMKTKRQLRRFAKTPSLSFHNDSQSIPKYVHEESRSHKLCTRTLPSFFHGQGSIKSEAFEE